MHLLDCKPRRRTKQKLYRLFVWSLLLLLLQSCSRHLGYGVLLWSKSDDPNMRGLHNGEIVTVISKSQVDDNYLISFENSERAIFADHIAFFRHRPNAQKYHKQFMQYRDWYAVNTNQKGLVLRSKAQRSAEQVYRLRPGQLVKVLNRASEKITMGNIEGSWYEVLTEDGVIGFAFDYYLRLEDRAKPAAERVLKLAAFEQSREELHVDLDSLKGIWYQKKYTQILRSGQNVALRLLLLPHGQLYLQQEKNQLELYLDYAPLASQILPYDPQKINVNTAAELNFNDKQIRAIFAKEDVLSFYFHNKNGEETILDLQKISDEELRKYKKKSLSQRRNALAPILQKGSKFSAAELYGTISFQADGKFLWSNTSALVKRGILRRAVQRGILFFPYQLGPNLQGAYDKLLTFVFDDQQELTFLLKIERGKFLRLRYVPPFMTENIKILNSLGFNEKLELPMQLEGAPLKPTDLLF